MAIHVVIKYVCGWLIEYGTANIGQSYVCWHTSLVSASISLGFYISANPRVKRIVQLGVTIIFIVDLFLSDRVVFKLQSLIIDAHILKSVKIRIATEQGVNPAIPVLVIIVPIRLYAREL